MLQDVLPTLNASFIAFFQDVLSYGTMQTFNDAVKHQTFESNRMDFHHKNLDKIREIIDSFDSLFSLINFKTKQRKRLVLKTLKKENHKS